MPRERRRRVHAGIASALEQQVSSSGQSKSAELAHHDAGAGVYERAVHHGLAAAQASLERSHNEETLAQTKQVSAWLPELPPEGQIEPDLRLRGINLQALMSAQGWAAPAVRELGEATRTLLPRSRTREHTVTTLFALFMHYYVASERQAAQRVVDELWDYADSFADAAMKGIAATARGVNLHAGGNFVESAVWLERALALYDPVRDRNQGLLIGMDCRVWATALMAQAEFNFGRTARGLQLGQEAIDWARQIRHMPSLALAILYLSQIYQLCGDREAVRLRIDELLQTAKTYGLPAFEGYGATVAAWVGGDSASVQGIIGVLRSLNCNLVLTYYGSFVADIEAEAGRIPEAVAEVEKWIAVCDQHQEYFFDAELWRRRGLYELRLPQPNLDTARHALKRACSLARERGIHRVEVAAIQDYLQVFSEDSELGPRLSQLLAAYPELSHAPRPVRALP
jgi:tetratricopeptide (TPR) repeat protein